MSVTIYHNPKCSTSRNALVLLRERGVEPKIVEYLKAPPSRTKLAALIKAMGIKPRELLRKKEAAYADLKLADPKWKDADIIAKMVEYPILIERPIVEGPKGVRLGRPAERVLEAL